MFVTIFDIKRFAIHDGPGIRTTVFFKGCSLSCQWCHNPESRSSECQYYIKKQKLNGKSFERKETIGKYIEINDLLEEIEKDRIFYEESNGGVTFSGGEPLMQSIALKEISNSCKKIGIHTTLDTTGFIKEEEFKETINDIDLFLYDIKHLVDKVHMEFTGVSNKLILKNLFHLFETKRNVIIRFPVIPDVNTDEKHLGLMAELLVKIRNEQIFRIDLLPYHKIGSDKYKRFGIESYNKKFYEPDEHLMNNLKERFEKTGFEVRIGG